jgi:hypothetical protein
MKLIFLFSLFLFSPGLIAQDTTVVKATYLSHSATVYENDVLKKESTIKQSVTLSLEFKEGGLCELNFGSGVILTFTNKSGCMDIEHPDEEAFVYCELSNDSSYASMQLFVDSMTLVLHTDSKNYIIYNFSLE